jgi:hypothetical protein
MDCEPCYHISTGCLPVVAADESTGIALDHTKQVLHCDRTCTVADVLLEHAGKLETTCSLPSSLCSQLANVYPTTQNPLNPCAQTLFPLPSCSMENFHAIKKATRQFDSTETLVRAQART